MVDSFRSIIELWPSRAALSAEIGIGDRAVSKWWQRDKIPSEWWERLLATDKAKSAGVTSEALVRLAAPREADGARV